VLAHSNLMRCLQVLVTMSWLVLAGPIHAQSTLHPGRLAPSSMNSSEVEGGAVESLGPGDTLYLTVYGRPEMSVQVTVDAEGKIVVPFIGSFSVANLSPSAAARGISDGLRTGGYLKDPQVVIEVVKVRSRLVSVLGQIDHPGRYPIEGRLTVLELLAMAGGPKELADDTAVVLRRGSTPDGPQVRIEVPVGNKQMPSRQIQDMPLQAGDVVYLPQVQRFFVYGEVLKAGAYPMEEGLNVMRALAIAGGLNARASDRRIDINRTDAATGEMRKVRAKLTDPILPGDVIHVDERFF
jgi:polysaccharide export outer membrane protein